MNGTKSHHFRSFSSRFGRNLGGFPQVVHRGNLRFEGLSARSDQTRAEQAFLNRWRAPQTTAACRAGTGVWGDAHFRWNLCAIRRGTNKNAPRRRNPAAIGSCAPLYSFDEKSAGPKPRASLFLVLQPWFRGCDSRLRNRNRPDGSARALDVERDSASASGDRPVQMAHEHVIGLWRAGDHVPFSLAVGERAEKTRRAYFAG